MARIEAEAENPLCDCVYGVSASLLPAHVDLFEKYTINSVTPAQIGLKRDEFGEDYWFGGAGGSIMVFLVNKDMMSEEEMPRSWADLTDEKYFGKIKSHSVEYQDITADMRPFNEVLEMALPDVSSVKVYERYLLPKYTELKNKIYDYLVLEEYLGGGATSALYKDLVMKQKIALSVGASYHFVSRGEGVFAFSLVPQNQKEFEREKFIADLHASADKAIKELNETKLAQIKRKMSADLVFVNDNPKDAANWIGPMLSVGFSLDDVQNYETNLTEVTVDGVKSAYENLKSAPRVNGVLLPENANDNNGGEK